MSVGAGFYDSNETKIGTSFLERVKPQEGYYDAVLHGTRDGLTVGLRTVDGVRYVNHRSFATFLNKNGYNGENIRLFSCFTGRCSTGGFAQNLSNKLGVKVFAPTTEIDVFSTGQFRITPGTNGSFRTFTPTPIKPPN
jgi:hypothetical protein